jgi:hypothetical protein
VTHSVFVSRKSRAAVAVLATTAAMVGGAALAATPALAQSSTGASVSLSPSSGSDFTSDSATLSWSVPSACVGNQVDTFLYQGSGPWNAAAINTAEGNNGGQTTYYNFATDTDAAATGSTSWPNVSDGYTDFGTSSSPVYSSTGALVSSLGTGYYTIAIACVNPTTFAPITNSSGAPIEAVTYVDLGASGNSWTEAPASAVGTQVALSGVGTSGKLTAVALKATVTASNGRTPAGTVNFYAANNASGTPLNSHPVKVKHGKAIFIGDSGYASTVHGAQAYTAVFTPARSAKYVPSTTTTSVNLIFEAVRIKVTATEDATTPSSLDVTATAVGVPYSLSSLIPSGGVNFIVDGTTYTASANGVAAPFAFNSNGEATDTITGLPSGTHTVTVQLADASDDPLNATVGYAVVSNTATGTTS